MKGEEEKKKKKGREVRERWEIRNRKLRGGKRKTGEAVCYETAPYYGE